LWNRSVSRVESGQIKDLRAVWIQARQENASTFNQYLWYDLIDGLPKELVGATAIRGEQDRTAVRRPRSGSILVLVESQAPRRPKTPGFRIHLRQKSLRKGVYSPEDQPLAVSTNTQSPDSSHALGDLERLALGLSGLLADAN